MRVPDASGVAIGLPFATDLHQPAGLASVLHAASNELGVGTKTQCYYRIALNYD